MIDEPIENPGDTGVVNDNANFLGSLGDDYKGHDLLKDVESGDALAKMYIDGHKSLEEAKSQIPTAPEDVKDYAFEPVEGVETVDEKVDAFRAAAKEMNLSKDQFKSVMAFDLARAKAVGEADIAANTETMNKLKQSMGDKFEGNMALAGKVLTAFGAGEAAEKMDLNQYPDLFNLLVNVGGAISEDKLGAPPTPPTGGDSDDPAQKLFGDGLSGDAK